MMNPAIPDLPDKLAQRTQWEADNLKAGQDKAKKTISFAKYTPLAFVLPFMNWLIDNLPGTSADGRGEAEFHYYTPRTLDFDPASWEWIDEEAWYFTKRGDRYCDLAQTYSRREGDREFPGPSTGSSAAAKSPRTWTRDFSSFHELYLYQTPEFREQLPWRVKLWEDTELPANFPFRMPPGYVDGATVRDGLQLTENGVPVEIAKAQKAAKDALKNAKAYGTTSTQSTKGLKAMGAPSKSAGGSAALVVGAAAVAAFYLIRK